MAWVILSECPCVCVGWRVIGGIFFYKQIQDLRDYGLGLLNGESKTCPRGSEVPAHSGSAWLHKVKSPNIISLYDWPHTASDQTCCLLHLLSPLSTPLVLLGLMYPSLSDPDPFSHWLPERMWKYVGACQVQIISCFLVRWRRGRNTWISVRDHYC